MQKFSYSQLQLITEKENREKSAKGKALWSKGQSKPDLIVYAFLSVE